MTWMYRAGFGWSFEGPSLAMSVSLIDWDRFLESKEYKSITLIPTSRNFQ
jgi:hypothetical protein